MYLGDTGTGTSDTSAWTPSAATWQQLSTTFTTGAATTSVTIYLHGWYGQGTYHADDVTMTGPGGSPPSSPTGACRPDRHRGHLVLGLAVVDRGGRFRPGRVL